MKIGFGNGDYYRLFEDPYDRFSTKYLSNLAYSQANIIELHCQTEEMVTFLLTNEVDLSKFAFISLHTPRFGFRRDQATQVLLQEVGEVVQKYSIDNVVVHPDEVLDWGVFEDFTHLPISIENMDSSKRYGSSIAEMRTILDLVPFNLILDLQHCYMVDPTMKIARDFHEVLGDRIVQYHISGFREEGTHYPLYLLDQDIIIESVLNKDLPIIIESIFDNWGDHQKEFDYISKRL